MTFSEHSLQIVSNPTIAYLLLTAGLVCIFFEIASPGAIVPGVSGSVAVVLGIASLGSLDANWIGLLLIGSAFALFAVDLHAPSHGVLSLGGTAMFALGSLMLERSSKSSTSISSIAVFVVTIIIAGFFLFAAGAALRTRLNRSTTGKEGMRGAIGIVREPINPEGYAFILGELWRARSENGQIPVGAQIRVVDIDGLTVIVEPAIDRARDPGNARSRQESDAQPTNSISA